MRLKGVDTKFMRRRDESKIVSPVLRTRYSTTKLLRELTKIILVKYGKRSNITAQHYNSNQKLTFDYLLYVYLFTFHSYK